MSERSLPNPEQKRDPVVPERDDEALQRELGRTAVDGTRQRDEERTARALGRTATERTR